MENRQEGFRSGVAFHGAGGAGIVKSQRDVCHADLDGNEIHGSKTIAAKPLILKTLASYLADQFGGSSDRLSSSFLPASAECHGR